MIKPKVKAVLISIHAPARGATDNPEYQAMLEDLFQSTLPREERRGVGLDGCSWISISIHAPARGATLVPCTGMRQFRFQSTLPREERQ